MKKSLFAVLLVAVVAFFCVTNVHAMSEANLTAKVEQTFNINGVSLTVPERYINLFEDYLSQYNITGDDFQYVADQIDVLVSCAKQNSVTSWSDFEKKCSSQIKTACVNVSANTGIKATVLSNGKVSVSKYNKPNEVFAIVDTSLVTNTGSANILYIAGTIALLGAGLLTRSYLNAANLAITEDEQR